MPPMILGVIPGWCAAPDPESRDSGFDASHRPGMTVLETLFAGCISGQALGSRAKHGVSKDGVEKKRVAAHPPRRRFAAPHRDQIGKRSSPKFRRARVQMRHGA